MKYQIPIETAVQRKHKNKFCLQVRETVTVNGNKHDDLYGHEISIMNVYKEQAVA